MRTIAFELEAEAVENLETAEVCHGPFGFRSKLPFTLLGLPTSVFPNNPEIDSFLIRADGLVLQGTDTAS